MSDVIKPCICGGKPQLESLYIIDPCGWGKSYWSYHIHCESCGRRTQSLNTIVDSDAKETVIGEWNMDISRPEYVKQLEEELRKANSIIELKRIENARLKRLVAELEVREATAAKRFYKEGIHDLSEQIKYFYTHDKTYDRPNAHTLIALLFSIIDDIEDKLTGEAK